MLARPAIWAYRESFRQASLPVAIVMKSAARSTLENI